MLYQHIFGVLCQGDQNGKDAVTNQLRLSEIPPAEKIENSSVDSKGETDGKQTGSLSVLLCRV